MLRMAGAVAVARVVGGGLTMAREGVARAGGAGVGGWASHSKGKTIEERFRLYNCDIFCLIGCKLARWTIDQILLTAVIRWRLGLSRVELARSG